MLYYLFRFLEQFNIPGSHMWSYISFRSLLAMILSLVISAWFGEKFIKWMKRRNISETARDKDIDPFGEKKKGVPTMGGIIIMVAILVPQTLVVVFVLLLQEETAYIVLAVTGLLLTLSHPLWLRNIYKRMMKRKYVNLDGFHCTRQ